MTPLSVLPSTREQARHALLLLGAPVPARIVVQVHRALFDGDLDGRGLAALLRAERAAAAPVVCCGLAPDLSGLHLALAEWPLEQRVVAPSGLAVAFARVTEFVRMQPGASRAALDLVRAMAGEVGGESVADLPASDSPREGPGGGPVDAEFRRAVAARAEAALDDRELLFGRPVVPQQRGRA